VRVSELKVLRKVLLDRKQADFWSIKIKIIFEERTGKKKLYNIFM
jgi:hypothetical protein